MLGSPAAFERPRIGNSNTVFKSGPLLISSRGLGWRSWKKRWFVLTRTSLVFYKNDPRSPPPRDGEVSLTLGGIDLNNSGSVVVREDKKLITVLFPDGRDGRAFTLKAETLDDLFEWKVALEHALVQAPNAALVVENNRIFRSDTNETIEGPICKWRTKRPVKSVAGCPILLALQDIDGSPSFLEKALRFLENYGIKIEGILRLSADVEEVNKRVESYEQGKTEFGPDEDAHVIGDCVKHALRELPTSPIPASSCSALLEAYRVDLKEARVNAMRLAIQEAFPETNRHLLQRILKMMLTISSHAAENRMTPPAVAACMAPLLLRPLFTGECESKDANDRNGDNSAQLLAAANAANTARAIITMLLEEYENIFDDDNLHSRTFSASDDGNTNLKINGYHYLQDNRDPETLVHCDHRRSGNSSGISGSPIRDLYNYKAIRNDDSLHESPTLRRSFAIKLDPELDTRTFNEFSVMVNEQDQQKNACEIIMDASPDVFTDKSRGSLADVLSSVDQQLYQSISEPEIFSEKLARVRTQSNGSTPKKSMFWRRKNGTRTPSESDDFSGEEELAIQRLEAAKNDLQQRIAKEARGNAILQASLEKRKQALHEQRGVLEQDVARLHAQLKAERDLRAALEVGLSMSPGNISSFRSMDSKTMVELEDIALAEANVARLKQRVSELHHLLNQKHQDQYDFLSVASDRYLYAADPQRKYFHRDFDVTLTGYNHERKRTEFQEMFGPDLRNIKGPMSPSNSSGSLSFRRHIIESTNFSDSRSTVPSPISCKSDSYAFDSADLASPSRATEGFDYPQHPSSTLVELTTRLDFFKVRRAQLMEQLQNLDLNRALSSPQDSVYNPSLAFPSSN